MWADVGVIVPAVSGMILALFGPNGLIPYVRSRKKGEQAPFGRDGWIHLATWGGLICFVVAAVPVVVNWVFAKHMAAGEATFFRIGLTALICLVVLPVAPSLLDSLRPIDDRVYSGASMILAVFACAAVIVA